MYHDNPDSQVGALKQEQKQACLFTWAEEAEFALGLPYSGVVTSRPEWHCFTFAPTWVTASTSLLLPHLPLAKAQRCTPQGWVQSHQCLFIGLFMANLDALSCYLAP